MTRTVDLLCLANSNKHGGRCVAGLSLDTGEWVRPVSDLEDGRLLPRHYLTDRGHDPDPLDTVRIHLDDSCPEAHQPENHYVSDENWELLDADPGKNAARLLDSALHSGPKLFGDRGRSIGYERIENSPVRSSLALVRPDSPEFFVDERGGDRKPVARFRLDGTRYDLTVTDPVWKRRILADEPLSDMDQKYESAWVYVSSEVDVLFTISLGTPHRGKCYKLVAAIVVVPADLATAVRTG